MMHHVLIIGAGVGGLSAAIRLAQRGCRVTVLEARDQPGGLAASFDLEGWRFDAGPYILLDRLGLEWAFRQVEVDIERLSLQRIAEVYETDVAGQPLRVSASLDATAAGIESRWPGYGEVYRRFIAETQTRYLRLQPLQCSPHPRLKALLRSGAWRDVPFLMRSLASVLAGSKLPASVAAALGIWTYVAGQSLGQAPSPLSLVPAVIHHVGAYYPRGGIGAIPAILFERALSMGVEFALGTQVNRICCRDAVATAVELSGGELLRADAVISNVGLATYLQLLDEDGRNAIPAHRRRMLGNLPLQSPGVCAYLAVRGRIEPPYLRFRNFTAKSTAVGCWSRPASWTPL